MNAANRHALIIGISDFDDPNLRSLPGCAVDLTTMHAFASDPQRGCFGDVVALPCPAKQQLLLAVSDLFQRAAGPDHLALLFVATHGLSENLHGLALCCKDTRHDRLSATTVSISELYGALNEFSCRRTILVIDACESGGIAGSISSLARDKLWRDLTQSNQEGHHVIASCGTRESAQEDSIGGIFTRHLLEVIERVGHSHPADEWLAVEVVAGEVVRAAQGLGQTPEWSGLSVSTDMPLCRNRHWDTTAAQTNSLLSSSRLNDDARALIDTCIRSNSVSLTRIGQSRPWSRDALRASREISASVIQPDIQHQYFVQTATAALLRVATYGLPAQQLEAVRYFQELIVLTAVSMEASRAGVADAALVDLFVRSLAPTIKSAIEGWRDSVGWLRQEDGPSAVALTCLRFWDALAAAAFSAVVLWSRGSSITAIDIVQTCKEIIKKNSSLLRLVWAGQYPDVVCVLSAVACADPVFAKECAVVLIRQLAERSLPLPPVQLAARDLGRELALQLFDQTLLENEYADEGLAALLAVAHGANASALELNALAATIPATEWRRTLSLYIPMDTDQCAMPQMLVRIPAEFSLAPERVVALLNALPSLASAVADDDVGLRVVLSLSGAAVYRNRTGIEGALRARVLALGAKEAPDGEAATPGIGP